MEELALVLKEFGAMGMWGIVLYKALDLIEALVVLWLIYYVVKKGFPFIKKLLEDI